MLSILSLILAVLKIVFIIFILLMALVCLASQVLLALSLVGVVKANNAAKTNPEEYAPVIKKQRTLLFTAVGGMAGSVALGIGSVFVYLIIKSLLLSF